MPGWPEASIKSGESTKVKILPLFPPFARESNSSPILLIRIPPRKVQLRDFIIIIIWIHMQNSLGAKLGMIPFSMAYGRGQTSTVGTFISVDVSLENPAKLAAIGGWRSPDALAWWATPWARGVKAVTHSLLHHPFSIIVLRRRVVMGGSSENPHKLPKWLSAKWIEKTCLSQRVSPR
jgi:hypothetical protein